MDTIKKAELREVALPGRLIYKAVGKDGLSKSMKMTAGYGRYSADSGPMETHRHAEELVYIEDVKEGWVLYGDEKDKLNKRVELEKGMFLHFGEMEWHLFDYAEGGYIDILFFYGQVDRIRPEEMD